MRMIATIAAICLLAGFAVARWLDVAAPPPPADAGSPAFDASLPLEARVRELERAVGEERRARQLLEDELVYLYGVLERDDPTPAVAAAATTDDDAGDFAAERRARILQGNSIEARVARLIAAGFAPDRADWIVRRESQLQMEALQARYDAEQGGDPAAYREARRNLSEALRSELGETGYERYLAGSGRPTSVAISNVLDSSPAQRAGLRPGDEILRYGGERIYSMSDLNRATYAGQPGETVMVEVMRDGTLLQIPLPRGPVGVMGGGRWRQ